MPKTHATLEVAEAKVETKADPGHLSVNVSTSDESAVSVFVKGKGDVAVSVNGEWWSASATQGAGT